MVIVHHGNRKDPKDKSQCNHAKRSESHPRHERRERHEQLPLAWIPQRCRLLVTTLEIRYEHECGKPQNMDFLLKARNSRIRSRRLPLRPRSPRLPWLLISNGYLPIPQTESRSNLGWYPPRHRSVSHRKIGRFYFQNSLLTYPIPLASFIRCWHPIKCPNNSTCRRWLNS